MRVAVWGKGNIGSGVVRRLTNLTTVSEVRWMNRSSVAADVLDIEHGLSFAPTCHHISAHAQGEAEDVLDRSDMLIITLGVGVKDGQTRADVFAENRQIFTDTVVPALRGFDGVVLVVTNPVDLMAREAAKAIADPMKVLGLGTVVETARLRASLSSHLKRPARDIDAFAVGTHDPHFAPVAIREMLAPSMDADEFAAIVKMAREEVAKAADEVKKLGADATLHPIVEGVIAVVDAVASDRRELLTVSVRDPENGFWYSVPCIVGSHGVAERRLDLIHGIDVAAGIDAMERVLEAN